MESTPYRMFYTLRQLSDELIYIRWHSQSHAEACCQTQYLADLHTRLDDAFQLLYFISDLRFGRISDARLLQQLSKLFASHPNYGGGTAFSENALSELFVGMFQRFSQPDADHAFFKTFPEAAAYLETLRPGICSGIDWQAILAT